MILKVRVMGIVYKHPGNQRKKIQFKNLEKSLLS